MIKIGVAILCYIAFNIPFAGGHFSPHESHQPSVNNEFLSNHQKSFSWADLGLQELLWEGASKDELEIHKRAFLPSIPKRFGPAIKILSCIGCMNKAANAELKYWTTERFLKDIIVTAESTRNKCIFYGKRNAAGKVPDALSRIATQFACNSGKTTIWHMWPRGRANPPLNEGLYDYYAMFEDGSHLQPIRDAGAPAYRAYFGAMSLAVARTCLGNIFVMSDTPDNMVQNQGLGGIWWDVELPELKRRWNNGELGTLTSVDTTDFSLGYNLNWDTMKPINRVIVSREMQEELRNVFKSENETSVRALGKRDMCSIPAQYEPAGIDFFG